MRDDWIIKKNNRINSRRETRENDDSGVSSTSKRESESNRIPKYIQGSSHTNKRRG